MPRKKTKIILPKKIPEDNEYSHNIQEIHYPTEIDKRTYEENIRKLKIKVKFNPKEDLEKLSKNELEQEKDLMELAYNKRIELKEEYTKLGKKINPLVLIQLPNDDQATKETDNKLIREIVVDYLKENEVKDTCSLEII